MDFRIGQGFDVHQLAEGESFIIGGIDIPHSKGTVAHSDGDVLIHAICDALLGSLNLRDIGYHFPDTSNQFKNIDSKILLKESYQLVKDKGYELVNIDSTICLQKPKIKDYIEPMKQSLAKVLEVDVDQISIKATTTEKLGFVGREEGISAHVAVLVKKSS